MSRDFHIILHGATGFTGRLVAAYLRRNAPETIRWAISGRGREKLEALRDELQTLDSPSPLPPICIADSMAPKEMAALALRAEVIISAVGPYSLYGAALVEACVNNGADYVDLTGENPFVRRMIDAHHEAALKAGRKIVHCCGFDSIPSDLGVLMLQTAAKDRFGIGLQEIKLYVARMKGGLSGGTFASMMTILENRKDPVVRRATGHPYGLNPKDGIKGLDGSDQQGLKWSEELQKWTAPFVMAAINTRVVRRSNALMDYAYGQDFRYAEVSAFPKGFKGWRRARTMTLMLGGFMFLALMPPTRAFLRAVVLPKPGQGPSRQAREAGFFKIGLWGRSADGRILEAEVGSDQDPGYASTAKMLAESALCLVQDRGDLPARFGVLTPASAMGMVLVRRLRAAGMIFRIKDQAR